METNPVASTNDGENKQTAIIFISIFGILCIILLCAAAAILYGLNKLNRIQQSNTATAQVNATSIVAFNLTQVAGYDLFDGFDDNHNHWRLGQEDNEYWYGNIDIRDGMYIWDVKGFHASSYASSWANIQNSKSVRDFDLSVDAKLLTPEAQNLCYAVAFRANPDNLATNGYEFHICDSQQFFVGYYGSGTGDNKEILGWTQSNAIRSSEWNTLEVSARGDRFILSINEEVVYEFTDSISQSGQVYLMIRYYEQIPGTIVFDNFGLQPR